MSLFAKDVVQNTDRIPVIVVFAPTACGKTDAMDHLFSDSNELSSKWSFFSGKGEIISADSMQVYRGMDIGTAKPTQDLLDRLPHHLIDLYEPTEQFGSGQFVPLADKICIDIFSRGKLPIICGGTAFYIRNFLYGLPITPESDEQTRLSLKRRLAKEGSAILRQELIKFDPISAQRIHENDDYRLLRALEVYYTTGKQLSSYQLPSEYRNKYRFCIIQLERERQEIYQRINLRVDQMFLQGLQEEVRLLIEKGFTKNDPGMQAIGYREFFLSEDAEIIKEMIKSDSRHYAKKQLMFFKQQKDVIHIPANDYELLQNTVKEFLSL